MPSRWNYGARDSSVWGYRVQPEAERTRLTHFHELVGMPAPVMASLYGRFPVPRSQSTSHPIAPLRPEMADQALMA